MIINKNSAVLGFTWLFKVIVKIIAIVIMFTFAGSNIEYKTFSMVFSFIALLTFIYESYKEWRSISTID